MNAPIANEQPLSFRCPPQEGARRRLTAFFRPILALPHLILVGAPPMMTISAAFSRSGADPDGGLSVGMNTGLFGALVGVTAIVSWVAILLLGGQPRGLWDLGHMFLRWRGRALAYMLLLRDEYPPFGDEPYPASVEVAPPSGERDRLRVALRLFIAIPYVLVMVVLSLVLTIVAVVAWFAIVFTGALPRGLHDFLAGFIEWDLRLEAFFLLLRDEYPPFAPRTTQAP